MKMNTFTHLALRALVLAAVVLAPSGFAQTPGRPVPGLYTMPFPPMLQQYLGLTDDQVSRVTATNQQLSELSATKAQRQIQLQVEISQEIRRPSPDAAAIGTRYVELEQIRRDLEAERTRTVASVQNILTEPQKGKLTALQQAMRDYPIACAAVTQNLMSFVPAVSGIVTNPNLLTPPTGGVTGYASFLLAPSSASGCSVPVAASRVGIAGASTERFLP